MQPQCIENEGKRELKQCGVLPADQINYLTEKAVQNYLLQFIELKLSYGFWIISIDLWWFIHIPVQVHTMYILFHRGKIPNLYVPSILYHFATAT